MTRLPTRDVLLSDAALRDLDALARRRDKEARSIVERARSLRPILLADCLHGEVVKKDRIPRSLRAAFQLENLYVEDLPDFWRFLYTLVKRDGERYIVVLRIVDHATYSRWFPSRRK